MKWDAIQNDFSNSAAYLVAIDAPSSFKCFITAISQQSSHSANRMRFVEQEQQNSSDSELIMEGILLEVQCGVPSG